ncbi:Myb domain plants domain-containing protein [Dioscorea alata]|uniref:Myb domain plants domain-containing protein n=1 Tax=Dioscorea alata TaxID=55571 RepID=A0ACB7US32_DIOAL|nr:Myb domain plants domain-containing protein [Dioscorea alata]
MLPGEELQDVITEPKFSDNVTVTAAPTLTSFSSSIWSSQENKMFEVELAYNPRETVNRWEKIAAKLPGRSVQEVIEHYEELTQDLAAIEAGAVQFPDCQDVDDDDDYDYDDGGGVNVNEVNQGFREPLSSGLISMNCSNPSSSRTKVENKKQRVNPWSEEEHKAFLKGLAEYGKGDWRSISRFAVKTRTASQVASHAQKFFIRSSGGKKSKRKSIHDITEC